jgi:hypothetical protein
MNQSKNQMSSKQEQSKTASKMRIRAFPVNIIYKCYLFIQ